MTSYPVIDDGEQKQDVLYRANSGVIIEQNALHRNAGSSDQRNFTSSSLLSLLPAHARVARQSHSCVGNTSGFVLCDGGSIFVEVFCRKASPGCSSKAQNCREIYTSCTVKGKFKTFVTGCKCL